MTFQTNTKNSGFREISPEELYAVSGGGDDEVGRILVTGEREIKSNSLTTDSLASLGIFGFGTGGYCGLGEGNHFGGGGTGEKGDRGPIDRIPDIPEDEKKPLLTDREKASALVYEKLGVPGPAAVALAKAVGILASYETKAYLDKLAREWTDAMMRGLIGPPAESTGDSLEDFRRAYGPILGPDNLPEN